MPHDDSEWPVLAGIHPASVKIVPMQPPRAQALFLKRYIEITEARA